jgi:hypothetical protein
MKAPTGHCIYRGASLIDGAPIIVLAMATKPDKANGKTGAMVQTYILREDVSPLRASKTGKDYSICGNCPHRGTPTRDKTRKQAVGRSCYVILFQGPTNVWHTYHRGRYPLASGHAAIAAIGRGQKIRLGTYGDPSAVPSYIWDSLLSEAAGHTAYSHQANVPTADFRADIFMRSADSEADARAAWEQGQRTFRVLRPGEAPVAGKEIDCPSSRGVHCIDCGLCGGAAVRAKSITIPVHGAGAAHFA